MSVILQDARRLANFMISLDIHSQTKHFQSRSVYNHLGALLTDIVLQSGLNYRHVVQPRVERVLNEFPYATTTPLLQCIVKVYTADYFLDWKGSTKTQRFIDILDFCTQNKIDDENQLRQFLVNENNKGKFLSINGVGPKTADYALKLMGVECVAVDRHVLSFMREAGIERSGYQEVKMIVEYAADLLCLSRTGVDSFIWSSMNRSNKNQQISINF